MKTKDLEGHISATYKSLRYWIAGIAFALPFVLWIGGHLKKDLPLQDSMSAYYHGSVVPKPAPDAKPEAFGPVGAGLMRDEFAGLLVAVGMILIIYQGVTQFEDIALNLAGFAVMGVAFLPMPWPPGSGSEFVSLHGACAIVFFLCIAYVCIFRAADTLPMLKDQTKADRFRFWYRVLGGAMIASPLAAWILSSVLHVQSALVFFVELAGIYVFATYWLVKGLEIAAINAQPHARRVRVKPHGLTQVFTLAPLTTAD